MLFLIEENNLGIWNKKINNKTKFNEILYIIYYSIFWTFIWGYIPLSTNQLCSRKVFICDF